MAAVTFRCDCMAAPFLASWICIRDISKHLSWHLFLVWPIPSWRWIRGDVMRRGWCFPVPVSRQSTSQVSGGKPACDVSLHTPRPLVRSASEKQLSAPSTMSPPPGIRATKRLALFLNLKKTNHPLLSAACCFTPNPARLNFEKKWVKLSLRDSSVRWFLVLIPLI